VIVAGLVLAMQIMDGEAGELIAHRVAIQGGLEKVENGVDREKREVAYLSSS
jgi:hypothetical protein